MRRGNGINRVWYNSRMKILLTGATGMLGRVTRRRLAAEGDLEVLGLCHARSGDGLRPVDLRDEDALRRVLETFRPDVVLHTAAVREPDAFAQDIAAARRLNVDATRRLAEWTAAHGAYLVYISTDYVFDGTAAPYAPDAAPHAVNGYGQSKLDGERAVRAAAPSSAAVLRVPILYADDVETLGESSATAVFAQVLRLRDGGAGEVVLDDWATRYPTHVGEIADVLAQMARRRPAGIFHWSGREPMTKLEMGRVAARILGVDPARLKGSGAPANGSEPRPKDCHLDCSALPALGIDAAPRAFAETARAILEKFA